MKILQEKMMKELERQCELLHYTPKTTFYQELTSIEDKENNEIEEFVNILIEQNKDDKIKGTELTIFLNWKCWYWFNFDLDRSKLYERLWKKIDSYIVNHWNKEDLSYFLRETD